LAPSTINPNAYQRMYHEPLNNVIDGERHVKDAAGIARN
jgi:hypothetical protein